VAKIIIYGAGAVAEMAHYYFTTDSEHEVVAVTVDRQFLDKANFKGLPVCAADEVVTSYPPQRFKMFVAMGYAGMNRPRAERYQWAKQQGYELPTYVSSRCSLLTDEPIGDNCLIMEDNTIQPFVRIGSDVILWSGNHLGHNAVIEDHCFITSHVVIAGYCRIGAYSFLGGNASIRDGVTVAQQTLVGMGATIMGDTQPKEVYLAPRAVKSRRSSDEVEI
jgi:sugar O-acyltransferase (sialic acid O-acetyltransferase NeuD family)